MLLFIVGSFKSRVIFVKFPNLSAALCRNFMLTVILLYCFISNFIWFGLDLDQGPKIEVMVCGTLQGRNLLYSNFNEKKKNC